MEKLLTTEEAAPFIGVERGTLENWRCMGIGPSYIKVGRLVRYDPADIEAWRASNRHQSTSD